MNSLQKKLLVIFKKLIFILEKNEIEYQAVGGTAIGAIREKAFISWDDDIDIAIKFSDRDKLIKAINKSNDFFIENKKSKQLFTYLKVFDTNTKIIECNQDTNLFIDVFFLWQEKEEKNIIKALRKNKRTFHYITMKYRQFKRFKYSMGAFRAFFVKLAGVFVFLNSFKSHEKMFNRIVNVKTINKGEYWYDYSYGQVNGEILKYRFNNVKKYQFEDIKINVSESFGDDNKWMFGDIMKKPEASKQVNHDIKLI